MKTFEEWGEWFRQSDYYDRIFPAMALEMSSQAWHARDPEIAALESRIAVGLALAEEWNEEVNEMKRLGTEPKWKTGEFEMFRVLESCARELRDALKGKP